jgi:hypothetical protein
MHPVRFPIETLERRCGFQPNAYYVGKLQEYGILPTELEGPIDVYAADRAYWKSFWYDRAEP